MADKKEENLDVLEAKGEGRASISNQNFFEFSPVLSTLYHGQYVLSITHSTGV